MLDFVSRNLPESLLIFLLGNFIITYVLIPKIINVVNHKELMDSPNARSSHKTLTPTFGGISFFVVLVFTLLLIRDLSIQEFSLNIISSLTVLLFIGLKDDLVVISNTSKLLGQILAIGLLFFQTNLHEINLHGLLGFYEITGVLGYVVSGFIVLSLVNAFNLIDGIDGLAASIGSIVLSFFAMAFYLTDHLFFVVVCVTLIGSLLAFLRFNLSSNKKIFMGDTGSQIIGFIVGLLTIKILTLDSSAIASLQIIPSNLGVILAAIMAFPIFDTLRILVFRISQKKSPLKADKNHIHHFLISKGLSHKKSSFIISGVSILFSLLFIYLGAIIAPTGLLLGLFLFSFVVLYLLIFKFSRAKKTY